MRTVFIAICIVSLAVVAYAVSTCGGTVEPAPPAGAPGCGPAAVVPADNELCGRYHLRKRTNQFFRRSIG